MKPGIYKGLYGGFIVIKKDSAGTGIIRTFATSITIAWYQYGDIPAPYNNHAWSLPNKWLTETRDNIRLFGELRDDTRALINGAVVLNKDTVKMFLKRGFERTPVECGLKKDKL